MLTGLHFLLTYQCTSECDHCFVFSSPRAGGTFTTSQVRDALDQAVDLGTIEWIYYEGGEPFLYYPVMLEGIRMARERGFKVGIVTNSYFATAEEDAEIWLRPIAELGIHDFRLSNDCYHFLDEKDNAAWLAHRAAKKLKLPVDEIHVEGPRAGPIDEKDKKQGKPITGGDIMFRGRAAEKLTKDLPRQPWEKFDKCRHEDLKSPGRIHLDVYGNTHVCQGISLGSIWETPLSTLAGKYDYREHPVCRPLAEGGPAQLAREYAVPHEETYVDECHFCYDLRSRLLDRFPACLTPPLIYGHEDA